MKYILAKAKPDDIDLLIEYKLDSILKYAENLSEEEANRIRNYVTANIPNQINSYKVIKIEDKTAGCLLVYKFRDGVLLDEIFIKEKHRHNGIGSEIIKSILNKNKNVYLWVYKSNVNAIKLYNKLGFDVVEIENQRYLMAHKQK